MRIFVGMIGLEAQIWLRYCLDGGGQDPDSQILDNQGHDNQAPDRWGPGVLEDPAVEYLAGRVEEMDAAALLEAMSIIRKRLSELDVLEGTDEGERIRVTRDYRIVLPDRFDTEIRLRPLVKTVFLLFLRHPEGIRYKDLQDYKAELTDLYQSITRRAGGPELERSIDRLIDPKDNSIHEKAANLAAALSRYFQPDQLPAYTITGKAGTPKRIRLDQSLIEWE